MILANPEGSKLLALAAHLFEDDTFLVYVSNTLHTEVQNADVNFKSQLETFSLDTHVA